MAYDHMKAVVDTNGTVYRLQEKLGEGGQGVVYAVEGGRLAIKLLFNNSQDERERLRRQIHQVRIFDLSDIPIACPKEVLRPPHVGYVMELLTGMKPIETVTSFPKREKTRTRTEWYLATGGLQHRLRLLARCADALSQLHGKGLVYGDISAANIFVSANVNAEQVSLIDADNLRYQSSPNMPCLKTGKYGAPELVMNRTGINTLTDAHAFAVLVFLTLCQTHPLMGDWVVEGDPDLEIAALEGRLPWIDHPADERNRSSHGFPRDIVLSPILQKLSGRAFGEGLTDPAKRPGMAEWADGLHRASDFTIKCPNCHGSYYANRQSCPWCNLQRPKFIFTHVKLWDPSRVHGQETERSQTMAAIALAEGSTYSITKRITVGKLDAQSDVSVIKLEFHNDQLRIQSLDGNAYLLTSVQDSRQWFIKEECTIRPQSHRYSLHFGDLKQLHRVATFEIYCPK
jgi:DNA-binding helix-hairpin-helix protein with protein kinase domain